jgi:Kef-type K+ transport system membrane component KefB
LEVNFLEILIFIISSSAFYLLVKLIKNYKENELAISMIIFSCALVLNKALFSLTIILDKLDGLISTQFYNWWASFIIMQGAATILWFAVLVTRRLKK